MAETFYAEIQAQMRIAIPKLTGEIGKLNEGDKVKVTIEKVKG